MPHAGTKNVSNAADADLKIVSLLVAKTLDDSTSSARTPRLRDYEIVRTRRHLGSTYLEVAVVLGNGLNATVRAPWGEKHRSAADLATTAVEICDIVGHLACVADNLALMRTEVLAAARREIAKARRQGLRYKLSAVETETCETDDWRMLGMEVKLEALDEDLHPQTRSFVAEWDRDVVQAFADFRERQAIHGRDAAGLARTPTAAAAEMAQVASLKDAA